MRLTYQPICKRTHIAYCNIFIYVTARTITNILFTCRWHVSTYDWNDLSLTKHVITLL